MTAYSASKAGVEAFAHALRGEVVGQGMDVGVAYFSFTDTDMVREVDADPVLGQMRAAMPWPFNRTEPLAPAIERMVRGIEGRKAHVHGQRWTRVLPLVRGVVPSVIAKGAPSRIS